jgi:hypothetical protein
MAKIINRGLLPPDDPIYKQGWTLYMGPQPKKPAETPSEDTPPENSESTTSSEKAAVENPEAEAEKTEE